MIVWILGQDLVVRRKIELVEVVVVETERELKLRTEVVAAEVQRNLDCSVKRRWELFLPLPLPPLLSHRPLKRQSPASCCSTAPAVRRSKLS